MGQSKSAHERRVQQTYGLLPGEYDELLKAQGGVCAICRKARRYRLDVDHCHSEGHVRMLACRACNRKVLKYARSDPEILARAAEMLIRPPAVEYLGLRVAEPDKEIWKTVPGYVDYECSTLGRVRSWKPTGANQNGKGIPRAEPLMLSLSETRGGYLFVALCRNGGIKQFRINRLVLITFVGDEPGMEACHNNGLRRDNRLSNLRWGSPSENSADKIRHGTQARGNGIVNAKLTEDVVRWARSHYVAGDPKRGVNALARRFGVSVPTMHKAITGKTWKHV
nr:endonuclease domain-containing protein [Streptomyces alboflavus]